MFEDRDGLIAHYLEMREGLLATLTGLTDDQMTEATIDGWSVKDHLAHLAFWDDIRSSEVVRISAGHESAWRLAPEQDGVLNEMTYEARRALSLSQVKWEWERSRQRLLDVIAVAPLAALDPARYGEAGLVSRHEEQHAGWIEKWRAERGY